jgi:hypothetical protein
MTKVLKIIYLSSIVFLGACSSKDSNLINQVPCEDGIQNRTETGLDCGGECEECPDFQPITSRFYLQFERSGTPQVYQEDSPYFEGNLTAFPLLNYEWGGLLNFQGDPEILEGKYLSFNREDEEYIEIMAFNGQNKVLSSAYPPNQSGSNCFIRKVDLIDTLITGIADTTINYIYSVKGDFNCRISNTDFTDVDTLNKGKFSFRITIIK